MGQNLIFRGIGSYLLFAFMFLIFVVAPVCLLMFLRLIVITADNIKVIYIFRLTTKSYLTKELKSTFTRKMIGNGAFPFDFYQTYLYFGQERRVRFSAVEFINYKTLRRKVEDIEKATCH